MPPPGRKETLVEELPPILLDRDWKVRCRSEEVAKHAWRGKFGWILDEYKLLNEKLKELREKRPYRREDTQAEDTRTVKPFPATSAHAVGWLSGRREFLLEKYGPYPYTRASRPPLIPSDSV